MPKINWKVRLQNPMFIAQIVMSILVPILGYCGLTVADLTTWKALGDVLLGAIGNPYCLGLMVVSIYNTLIDPTTSGISDSQTVLEGKTSDELLVEIDELKDKLSDDN